MSTGAAATNALEPVSGSAAAAWSFVLGILSLILLWIFGSVVAIILGFIALWRIEAKRPLLRGRGAAITGIATGAAGVLIGVLVARLSPEILAPQSLGGTTAFKRPLSEYAEVTGHQLRNSISAYYTEYRRYPVREAEGDVTLDTGDRLMGVLLASKRETGAEGLNPRGIVFYADRPARALYRGGRGRGLVTDPDGGGILLDPWGRPYRVRLDTDGDGRLENPDPAAPVPILEASILVWSAGPDGDFDTWKDNLRSW